jgi:UDP-GlcNAc:undecaprenyl-phosphate GlcNAc-1-phosphate transferase
VHQNLVSYLPLIGVTFLVALACVGYLAPKVRDFALRVGAVQHGGGRRIHLGAVPNIGGLAIFGGFVVALLAGSVVRPHLLDAYRVELLAIVLGGALMTLVGFMDDVWEVPPVMRLTSQFVAAGVLVVNGVRIDFITNYFGGPDYLFFGQTLSVVLTLVWVVGFTNAFNFIDGLDGLSAGIAAISSLSLLAVAVQFGDRGAAVLLLAALAGAALGFLRHNFNPAKIIMGDSGACMLGYTLAAVSVLGALKVTAVVTVVAPVLVLALPVVNLTQVTLRRLSHRRNPAAADNDHIHDIIRRRSGSNRFTVMVLWLATLLLGALGMVLSQTPPKLMYLTVALTVFFVAAVSFLRLREAARERHA